MGRLLIAALISVAALGAATAYLNPSIEGQSAPSAGRALSTANPPVLRPAIGNQAGQAGQHGDREPSVTSQAPSARTTYEAKTRPDPSRKFTPTAGAMALQVPVDQGQRTLDDDISVDALSIEPAVEVSDLPPPQPVTELLIARNPLDLTTSAPLPRQRPHPAMTSDPGQSLASDTHGLSAGGSFTPPADPVILMTPDGPVEIDVQGEPVPVLAAESGSLALPDELNIVQVFFGTDRAPDIDLNAAQKAGQLAAGVFSNRRASKPTLGSVFVNIPVLHHQTWQVGQAWAGSKYGLRVTWPNGAGADGQFTITRLETLDSTAFASLLKETVARGQSHDDQALIFVPGHNVGFDAAAYRTAQIAYDLQFDGAVLFYSWPSNGARQDYDYDQNSARRARFFLEDFIDLVRTQGGAKTVHIIAHSLGADPILEVLSRIKDDQPGAGDRAAIGEVILAAPDIDIDIFRRLASEAAEVATGVTLYVSSTDQSLSSALSSIPGVLRAGMMTEAGPLTLPGIDTIDATAAGTELFWLNRPGYAENRLLVEDISTLLRTGQRPPHERTRTLLPVPRPQGDYWSFPRQAVAEKSQR